MGLANVLCKWDYPMCWGTGKGTNVHWEWDYPMTLGIRLSNVPWEWD